jgi:hypothetical protein
MKKKSLFFSVIVLVVTASVICCSRPENVKKSAETFEIPADYLKQADDIPSFWVSEYQAVNEFIAKTVKKGKIEVIGTSAGGRKICAVTYGTPRQGTGTTTFSGSLGYGDVKAYRGPDHDKTVYMSMAAVHGGEFEGIVGMVNLISVLETGKDLRGKEWPEITENASRLNRIVLIPVTNPDGRERIPLRMESYRDTDFTVAEYLNTGGDDKGKITGWPQIKEFIPMDFSKPGFPGGYPNDNGVNIQHDDFLGKIQPETKALFDVSAREKPDIIINLHTGAVYMLMHRPMIEPVLMPFFDSLFKSVHSGLALKGLQYTNDPEVEGDASRTANSTYNLDCALNLNCGALSVVVESPSHSFSGNRETQKRKIEAPDNLLDAQLTLHQQAMKFLAETGGRSKWLPGRRR